MIETDRQRRWWFATHPEYSSSLAGEGRRAREDEDDFEEPMRFSPQDVDEYVDEQLKYAKGLWAELLKAIKEEIGTPAASKRSVMMAGGVRTPDRVMFDGPGPLVGGGLLRGGAAPALELRPPVGGGGSGPGKWVEVGRRGGKSLEHQSNMSGQPIREVSGKPRIMEYELNGVKFDDYKRGTLYEYKGDHRFLFDKNDDLRKWVKNPRAMRDQAVRQADAAKPWGLSIIWRVGKDQVEAFRKAVGRVKGISIVP